MAADSPNSSSWLNLVEPWFRELTDKLDQQFVVVTDEESREPRASFVWSGKPRVAERSGRPRRQTRRLEARARRRRRRPESG